MKHDRRELLKRVHELRQKPFEAVLLDVALTCRLNDDELCEVIQEVLQAVERRDDWEQAIKLNNAADRIING